MARGKFKCTSISAASMNSDRTSGSEGDGWRSEWLLLRGWMHPMPRWLCRERCRQHHV